MLLRRVGIPAGRTTIRSSFVTAGVMWLIACASRQTDEAARQLPLLRIEARDFSFTAPTGLPAGPTRIRLVNHGTVWHESLITRLPDSLTSDAYLAGARAGEDFPVNAVDFGGPGLVTPGDSSEVVVVLEPGRYAIVCWSDNHVKSGMIASLMITVSDSGATTRSTTSTVSRAVDTIGAPTPTSEVRLEDFRFVHDSSAFRTGANVLRVRNTGARPHDMAFFKLEPGRTAQDYGAWFATRQGPPPARPVGGMSTLAPGHDAWLILNLPAGNYFVVCGTPEPTAKGVQLHAQMGMVEVFELH